MTPGRRSNRARAVEMRFHDPNAAAKRLTRVRETLRRLAGGRTKLMSSRPAQLAESGEGVGWKRPVTVGIMGACNGLLRAGCSAEHVLKLAGMNTGNLLYQYAFATLV